MTTKLALAAAMVWLALSVQQPAEETVHGITTDPGLAVTLWASEPQLSNPTDMAIDERGRIWIAEAVNYRRWLKNLPDIRPEGDRILILEDTDHDGRADKVTVFDQSPEIRAPLGIAVFGDKVIVSQSPNITVYTKDAQDHIVSKETFLSGFKGVDHDHGVHAVVFGPDGHFYFNAGNEGFDVTDKSGTHLKTDGVDLFQGVSLRVNADGTGLQAIAQNFRNPYELALDSFGTIFQTDNDDDGNAWTRLNYVMPGGNYGYHGPLNRTWREDRGTHFHNELPGVVPNILRLGAGAPCGLLVYEGTLLPEKYRGQLMHAEAGKRIVAFYPLTNDGAGYATKPEALVSAADTWFRPSDVAVAPDGSVFIADWYDPDVGGHGMGDPGGARGRIYRLAPAGAAPRVPPLDLASQPGLLAALRSPNQDVFYLAHSRIRSQGIAALPLLQSAWRSGDAVLRARALWLAGALGKPAAAMVQEAAHDKDERFRILALRVTAENGGDVGAAARALVRDPSPQVRREILLLLHDPRRMAQPYLVPPQESASNDVLGLWTELAKQYDGKDRWYLEALGIAARGREDALYARVREAKQAFGPSAYTQLLIELRPKAALQDVVAAVGDASLDLEQRTAMVDVLGSMQWPEAARAMEALLTSPVTPRPLLERAFRHYAHQLFSLWPDSRRSPALAAVLHVAFADPALQPLAVETVDGLGDEQFVPDLLTLARDDAAPPDLRASALDVVGRARRREDATALEQLSMSGPVAVQAAAVRARGQLGGADTRDWAQAIVLGDAPNEVRVEALRALARSPEGLNEILDLAEQHKLPTELTRTAAGLVNGLPGAFRTSGAGVSGFVAAGSGGRGSDPSAMAAVRARAAKVLPLPTTASGRVPTLRILERDYRGSAEAGRKVFEGEGTCSACHSLGGPKKLGPDLSAIGDKLGKQGLLDAILNPSEAIAPEYQVWVFTTKNRGEVMGLIVSETPDAVVVNTGTDQPMRLNTSGIVSRRPHRASMMPEGLLNNLTPQQIADLLEFLATRKKG